ncbi:hypothetical protein PIB30_049698 [Stylosanthes scabra]|uniref:Uncharacterized protein n=1 Tax=Stylosanthes scabra TaxID=79078 RepID=A0ABU6YG77_9FABA|nr:hypothetical protein [Stylosanthes scabra]
MSSKPYHIACVRRAPKSLFGEVLLAHTHLSHKPPTFRLSATGYAGSPKPLEDVEDVVYTDHSGDDQHQNQQQQQALDLNATANEATGSGNINAESGGTQNGQPPLGIQPHAIDKVPSIGLDRADQTPDLSAEWAMESEVRELKKENAELQSSTKDPQPRTRTSPRRRSRSQSRSPPRRNLRSKSPPQAKRTQRSHTPARSREEPELSLKARKES